MANFSAYASGYSSARVTISGLEYYARYYNKFAVAIYRNDVYVTTHEWTSGNLSNSTSSTITGLNPDTTYWLDAYATWDGVQYFIGGASITTDSYAYLPDTPTGIRYSRVDAGLKTSWNTTENADSYDIYLKRYYDGVEESLRVTSTTYTWTGLQYGVRYQFSVEANNAYGTSSRSGLYDMITAPRIPILSVVDTVNTTVTLGITGMSGNYTGFEVYVYDINGTHLRTVPSTSSTIAVTGLTKGITYKFNARSYYYSSVDSSNIFSAGYSAYTEIKCGGYRPDNWAWSYSISSGAPVYRTVISNNIIYADIMLATEWNNFTQRINDFRAYKGLANYNFTTVSVGTQCTAGIINQAVTAINAMGFSIATVGTGSIPAAVFIQMRDKINSIT